MKPSSSMRVPNSEKPAAKSGRARVLYINTPLRSFDSSALDQRKVDSYLNRTYMYLKKYSVQGLTVVQPHSNPANEADEQAENVLMSLARSIEAKDPYTEGHGSRISGYAVSLGENLCLDRVEIRALRQAGVLHDIGKVAIPDEILLKPGPLTAAEREIVEQHPLIGEQICRPLKSFGAVLPIIRHHHERIDGTGYPDRLAGETIPLTARILQVVDIFDALTTDRPYRQALTKTNAFDVMRLEAGHGWLDSELLGRFERLV
ncbi:MAG: HD-GYP domain-containing protein [Candidatus Acidiferrales bacterium]